METSAIAEAFEPVTARMPATTAIRAAMPNTNPKCERKYAQNEYARSALLPASSSNSRGELADECDTAPSAELDKGKSGVGSPSEPTNESVAELSCTEPLIEPHSPNRDGW